MAEVLLVRHAKSYANLRDFTAFGNRESPLNDEGIVQAIHLFDTFMSQHGIIPTDYEPDVLASDYTRPQETARHAGFRNIEINELVNESDFDRESIGGINIVLKHAKEKWVPEETVERAARLIELIRTGQLGHQIIFTHGLFIATVLTQLEAEPRENGATFAHEFSETRGFIPRLATIVPVTI